MWTDEEIMTRVRNGIEWLDENIPDWLQRLDVERLDMKSDCKCILGQLDGSWCDSTDNRDISYRENEDLGFCIGDDVCDRPLAWGNLEYWWTEEINRLRSERSGLAAPFPLGSDPSENG